MIISDFVNKYNGRLVDFDNAYGAQCVDLFRQYVFDVWGITEHTGAVEGAKDLYLNYKNMPREMKYFEKIPASHKRIGGDVLVFDATPKNKYGHVCIMLGEYEEGFLVFEQNGFTQDGAKIVFRSKFGLLGCLRRRKDVRG